MDALGLLIAGLIVGAVGRLANRGHDRRLTVATLLLGAAVVVGAGLLLAGIGFWGYLVAVAAGAAAVGALARAWPEPAA